MIVDNLRSQNEERISNSYLVFREKVKLKVSHIIVSHNKKNNFTLDKPSTTVQFFFYQIVSNIFIEYYCRKKE